MPQLLFVFVSVCLSRVHLLDVRFKFGLSFFHMYRIPKHDQPDHMNENELRMMNNKTSGYILQDKGLHIPKESRMMSYPLSFILRNTKPAGHQVSDAFYVQID